MSMTLNITAQYWAFVVFIIATFGLCAFMLVFSWLLGGRSTAQSNKNVPFESGVASVGDTHLRFSAKFYLVAMFFVIFDVEALFLYAWAVSIRENGWIGFIEASIFILVLMLSLIYLVRTGAMNWSPLPRHVVVKSNLVSYNYNNYSFTKINIFKTRQ